MARGGINMEMEFEPIKEEPMNSVERVMTALSLKEPDRVPVWPLIDFLPAHYIDITAQEILEDPDKSQYAYEWIYHKLGGYDIAMAGGGMYMMYINPFPDFFSAYYVDWRLPGRMLGVNEPPQLVERSLNNPILTEKDYDKIINEGLLWLANFERAGISDMTKLPKIGAKVEENTIKWWTHYKVPTFTEGAVIVPFDLLSVFRGATNFMKDIYRYPDKIKEVCDFLVDNVILMGEYGISQMKGKTILVGAVRASADFISIKHFEELFWPYFKKIVTRYVNDGFIVQLHMDTNWTDRLHYLLELPKGKIYMHMDERTDIFKAKEILGDHMCIQGNMKPSLFTLGTPAMVEKQTKEIIDKCAEGGGLLVGAEIPDNAKLENLRAMIDTCKTYGVYRK
ncbi:MAG: uroporphyrinogen decarboxylase family protein [Candidatus Thorarchaeota archaeon]